MLPVSSDLLNAPRPFRALQHTLRALAVILCLTTIPNSSAQSNEILPLEQVRPGMQGYAYTIFAGDQVEKFDLEVIGVMPNFLDRKSTRLNSSHLVISYA